MTTNRRLPTAPFILVCIVGLAALTAWPGCGCSAERAPCNADDQCPEGELCYLDGLCVAEDIARRRGGLGDECSQDLPCIDGTCWAGFCTGTSGDGGPLDGGADGGPLDAGPDSGPLDAGPDSGPLDAGPDSGPLDAGPTDSGTTCGNGVCEVAFSESCATCEPDCGLCCGDGICEPIRGEDCTTCVGDCGACPAGCGDGWCDTGGGEDCGNCSSDCPCCGAAAVPPAGIDYATDIQPILDLECISCHVVGGGPNSLDLTSYSAVITGGDNGSEVSACDCASSNIWLKTGTNPPFGGRMPADGPPWLTPAQRGAICDWINQGADLTYTPWACGGPPSCDYCGDGTCTIGEDCAACAPDCGACSANCPDGTCGAGESCSNCPMDCGSCCGDGTCDAVTGETCTNCAADCTTCCGDGTCETAAAETCMSCTTDCGACTDTQPPTFAGVDQTNELNMMMCDVSWFAASDNITPPTMILYEVFAVPEGTPFDFTMPWDTSTPGATSIVITLPPGQRYDIVVRAVDQSGNSDTNLVIERCDMR